MMWGSDFPAVSFREGYANFLNWCREYIASEPAADQSLIFEGTAPLSSVVEADERHAHFGSKMLVTQSVTRTGLP